MAYRIECDRCNGTEKVSAVDELPTKWLQFNTLWLGEGEGNNTEKPISGGVFCPSCVKDLQEWRNRPPAKAMTEEEFRRRA
jgi:hypothetical protein